MRCIEIIAGRHFSGEEIGGTRFVGRGSCNLVYALTVNSEEVIVRLTDRLRRGAEHAREAWCIQSSIDAGIPGPCVLAVGQYENASYMVQEYVNGARGESVEAQVLAVWNELGRFARIIHQIRIEGYPDFRDESPDRSVYQRTENIWKSYVKYGVESLTAVDKLIELGVYRRDQQPMVKVVFDSLNLEVFRFGLCHGDLSLANTLVGGDGEVVLLDWGCASVGIVPQHEFAGILQSITCDDPQFNSFLDGYGMSRAEFDTLLPTIHSYRLLQAFDLVRWSIDRRPEELDSYVNTAREVWRTYQRQLNA